MNEDISYFSYLSDDEILNIALQLNINDISYYCLYNSRFNDVVCKNNWFWKEKFLYDFGNPEYNYVEDWKSLYKNYGSVYVFGINLSGQLGLDVGMYHKQHTPRPLSTLKFKAIFAGYETSFCVDFNNILWVFGNNNHGQLGLGDTYIRKVPTKMPLGRLGWSNFKLKSVAAGGYHTAIIDFDNNIWVFGNNEFGQLGLGNTKTRLIPEKIPRLKAKFVAAGLYHTIVIDFTDSLWVFGRNNFGQLGLGNTDTTLIPTKIENLKFKFVTAGYYYTAALDFNNNVWVFGENNSGQLGLGDMNNRFVPTQILSPAFGSPNFRVKSIVAGEQNTVALDFNNEVWTFGDNMHGQLGLGDKIPRTIPTKIAFDHLPNFQVKSIFVKGAHTMVIDFNDEVWAFGYNNYGQLGLGHAKDTLTPEKIPNFKANFLATGGFHTLALSDYSFIENDSDSLESPTDSNF
jgi:alpha-tubulin suppressor-like RCC1 family protein